MYIYVCIYIWPSWTFFHASMHASVWFLLSRSCISSPSGALHIQTKQGNAHASSLTLMLQLCFDLMCLILKVWSNQARSHCIVIALQGHTLGAFKSWFTRFSPDRIIFQSDAAIAAATSQACVSAKSVQALISWHEHAPCKGAYSHFAKRQHTRHTRAAQDQDINNRRSCFSVWAKQLVAIGAALQFGLVGHRVKQAIVNVFEAHSHNKSWFACLLGDCRQGSQTFPSPGYVERHACTPRMSAMHTCHA
jgi:hypothetical protein